MLAVSSRSFAGDALGSVPEAPQGNLLTNIISDDGANSHVVPDRGSFIEYRSFTHDEERAVESVVGCGQAEGIGVSKIKGCLEDFSTFRNRSH